MKCSNCDNFERTNRLTCSNCGAKLEGGVIFCTGISGTDIRRYVAKVKNLAASGKKSLHIHNVGDMMKKEAISDDPDVNWDRILDGDDKALRLLRTGVFKDITYKIKDTPDDTHLIICHLSFRWRAYITRGFDSHILENLRTKIRFFATIIDDLDKIRDNLKRTSWGRRKILELALWRDEEVFLTSLLADIFGRTEHFIIPLQQPESTLYKLIFEPNIPKVYLSFPITNILGDSAAKREIEEFRDRIRDFLVVFDPYAIKDYDLTYRVDDMKAIRVEIGDQTKDRDFRFIDQSDAIVVYYPKKVASKGVDAEMAHAFKTGKRIFLYTPDDLGGGPFAIPADHVSNNKEEYINILRRKLLEGKNVK